MAVAYSKGLTPGTPAPEFSLPGVDGKTWSLDDFRNACALVVVFTCNHCPYAKASEERLVQLQRDYADATVRLVAINPNDARSHPEDSFDQMKARAHERKFNFPYLRDESQEIARAYNAVCTPDIYVFDAEHKLVCQTRLDDSPRDPSRVGRAELREILDAVLANRALPFEPQPAVGCSIKWQ